MARFGLSKSVRRAVVASVGVVSTALATAVAAAPAGAQGLGITQPTPVSAVPAKTTPSITNGTVYAITQVGSLILAGGSFTTVQNPGSTTNLTRTDIVAFDPSTGTVSASFAPTLNGTVRALQPGPAANTVLVGGSFTTVNGATAKHYVVLNTQTGAIVSSFKSPAVSGTVYTIAVTGGHILVGGAFTSVGGKVRDGLASLSASTGALDTWTESSFTGHHNYDGTSNTAKGGVGPRAIAVSPDGTQAVVIGNFTSADGLARDQIALLDLSSGGASVDPNWSTQEFTAACFNWAFDTYVTDVQYAADGSYFVVTATGGSGTNTDGSRSLCDSASRWNVTNSGTDETPAWVDYTGQDSLWSVAITGSAIYVGGHQRWLNNSNGYDRAGAGAVPRPGLAALDPESGVPLTWNPGRNPRGAGAYALLAVADGLYVGSDTQYIGNREYKRPRIAFFPLAKGVPTASTATTSLPSNVYMAGQLPAAGSTNILYRSNTGGPEVGATDNGPDWLADSQDGDPGSAYRISGSNAATWDCCVDMSHVSSNVPVALFDSERWYPGGTDTTTPEWDFPVPQGDKIDVRLYFANSYSGTSQTGQRVFNVLVDGQPFLSNYDIVADVGNRTAVMHDDLVTPANGHVTINFTHGQENPLIDAIELVDTSMPTTPATSTDDLTYRAMSGSKIGPQTTVANTGIAWGSTRGAFMVGNTIFYGNSDGTFHSVSFDGNTVGTPQTIDPYDDPYWANIDTGSGQTYQGVPSGYYGELSSVTGAFYSAGRLYYSLVGDSHLYWRWFSPDSGIVGSQEFTSQNSGFPDVAGMFLSGSTLYYASRADGSLHSVPFADGQIDSANDTIVSGPALDGKDWRTRGMFLDGTPTFPNQPPVASATASCSANVCDFDASGSSDPDGSITSYAWDFGDGRTGSGVSPRHSYSSGGTYDVTLTVTDNQGATGTWQKSETVTDPPTPQLDYVAGNSFNGRTASPTVSVPAAVTAGNVELLYVSTSAAGVTTSSPSGGGWQQLTRQTNGTIETTVFWRTASAGDPATVSVPLASSVSVDVQLVAYQSVATSAWTVTTAADSNAVSHDAPPVTVGIDGSWVVSYWALRETGTPSWTYPAQLSHVSTGTGSGGGHIDALLGDSGAPVSTGTYPAQPASSGLTSGRAAMVSVALKPASAPADQPPVAQASVSCSQLTCAFDGSSSYDPDGAVVGWHWDFADGTTRDAESPNHTFAQSGTYHVTLVVTDDAGLTSAPQTSTVTVSGPAATAIAFVGRANVNGGTNSASVTVPAGVNQGDLELLFASTSTTGVLTSPSGNGWSQLSDRVNGPFETAVFWRAAPSGDAGSTVTVGLTSTAQVDLQLVAYTHVDTSAAPTSATAVDVSTSSHSAPAVAVSTSGSWVVSYWAVRDSGTANWTYPDTFTRRNNGAGTGGGHVDTLVGDSGGAVATGSYGPVTADSAVTAGRGDMVSVVLPPSA